MLKSGGRKAPGAAPETASWKGFLAPAAAFCWAAVMVLQKWLLSVHDLPAASITPWRALFLPRGLPGHLGSMDKKRTGKRLHLLRAPREIRASAVAAGIFGLAAGGYVFALAIQIIPVSVATPITATSPLIAAGMAVVLFHESMRPVQWAGILCILEECSLSPRDIMKWKPPGAFRCGGFFISCPWSRTPA